MSTFTTAARRAMSVAAITAAVIPALPNLTATAAAPAATAAADEINGVVWKDVNADGVNDPAEPGLNGMRVTVFDALGAQVGQQTTGTSGLYSFTGLDPTAGPYQVTVTRDPAVWADPANWTVSTSVHPAYIGTDQDFVLASSSGAPVGEATGIAPGSTVDAAIRPRPELGLGLFGPGIIDGTAPFNTSGSCADPTDMADPGDDCGEDNNQLRTGDTLTSVWSITADNFEPGTSTWGDVIFEQTLTPVDGAVVNFERIPVSCLPPPDGTGGTGSPASAILNNFPAAGQITLRCNLGQFTEGGQESLTTAVKLSAVSPNGSSFTMSERVYVPGDRAVPAAGPSVGPIETSARPAYDLIKMPFRESGVIIRCVDTDSNPATPCENLRGNYTYTLIRVAAEQRVGIEALQQPFSFTEALSMTLGDGVTPYTGEWYITECGANPSGWGDVVLGRPFGRTPATHPTEYPRTLDESGNCAFTRPTGAPTSDPYTITLSGADLDGSRFPTQTWGGATLAAGPFIVIEHRVLIFVPTRTVDMSDGTMDNAGTVQITNRYSGFDPTGVSGTSNYGDGVEPGFCVDGTTTCSLMSNGTRSNNVVGPLTFRITVTGSFSKYQVYRHDNFSSWSNPLGVASSHDGGGQTEVGDYTAGMVSFQNSGSLPMTNPRACDVFDNTVYRLATANNIQLQAPTHANSLPNAASRYAYVTRYNAVDNAASWPDNFIIEYANIPLAGDDPLYNPARVGATGVIDSTFYPGVDTFNTSTGRFDGVWNAQRAARCTDSAPPAGWFTDPTAVPGGLDGVNAVRIRPVDPAFTLDPGYYIRLIVPMQTRSTFNGGPRAGQVIPQGTVYANYGLVKADNWAANGTGTEGQWRNPNYRPSPETGDGDGDRVTLSRLNSRLQKRTLTPLTNVGASTSTLAGNQIVWELIPQVSTGLVPSSEIARNTIVYDVLPPFVSYNAACTAALNSNPATATIMPSNVEYNTNMAGNTAAGFTRLTYVLGDLPVNVAIPRIRLCTDTDSLAPNGTTVTNVSRIVIDDDITSLALRQDDHTIILEQNGAMQIGKQVDRRLDPMNDTQVYTIEYANFAAAFTINAPTMIDVFPWNGDQLGSLSERDPASDYTGTLELTAAPTVTFKNGSVPGAGDPFPAIGQFTYTADAPATINYNPDLNTSTWCAASDFGTAGCPASFAEVTAFKFVSNYPLAVDGNPRQGHRITFTLQADGNSPGDRYTNRATVDSSSLPAAQFLRSNNVIVEVASFDLGDLVYADINNDGNFDAGVDIVAPENVTVELYDADTDTLVAVTQTNAAGRYKFTGLNSGDFYAVIPAAMFAVGGPLHGWTAQQDAVTDPNTDANERVDHNAIFDAGAPNGVRSNTITLSATVPASPLLTPTGDEPRGDNTGNLPVSISDDFTNFTLDFGLAGTASFGDRVWYDTDGDGIQDPTEQGINAATVTAVWPGWDGIAGTADDVTYVTVTDGDGDYLFENIPAGDYTVTVTGLDPDWAATADLDGASTANTTEVTIVDRTDRDDVDFGYTVTFTLGNRVFADLNRDGNFDVAVDAGIPNVTVHLYRAGELVPYATTVTDADGLYEFAGLPPGDFYVRVPAAEMMSGGLAGYDVAPDGVTNPNGDIDDTADHNAFEGPFGGVNTGTITLSATHTVATGAIVGDEPGGYANATLDLAFWPPLEPQIHVKKYTNGEDADTATGPYIPVGDTATWTYAVTNPGNVALADVTLVDDAGTPADPSDDWTLGCADLTGGDTDDDCILDIGEVWTFTADGTATEGQYRNIAAVTGQPADPSGAPIPGVDPVTDDDPSHYWGATTGITLTKFVQTVFDADTPTGPMVASDGVVKWSFTVTNTGNTALASIQLTDPTLTATGSTINCPANVLAAGASMTCVAYAPAGTAGQHSNTAQVTGTPVTPSGTPITELDPPTDNDIAHYFVADPAIDIEKSVQTIFDADTAAEGPLVEAGSPVRFTYTVRNTGNVPLTAVTVTDDIEGAITCPATSLAVGASMTCTLDATAINSGSYANTGSARGVGPITVGPDGTPVAGRAVTDADMAHYRVPTPEVDIQKFVQTTFDANPGDPIPAVNEGALVRFTYIITNTGNVELYDVTVTDDIEGAVCTIDKFPVGAQETCTITAPATSGGYTNLGIVEAAQSEQVYGPTGNQYPGGGDNDTDPAAYTGVTPRVDIEKSVQTLFDADDPTGPAVRAGDPVKFTYTIRNTGNVPLVNVVVTDDMLPASDIVCPANGTNVIGALAVAETVTCWAYGTAIEGQYVNVGYVEGVGPQTVDADGNPVAGLTVADKDAAHYIGLNPAIDIEKYVQTSFDADTAAEGPLVAAGAPVRFLYVVTNTGTTEVAKIVVTDNVEGAITCPDDALKPGDSMTCVLDTTAITGGAYSNTGAVVGVGPETVDENGDPVDGAVVSDDDLAHYTVPRSGIEIETTVQTLFDADASGSGPLVAPNGDVLITYTVTNTGSSPLAKVEVSDDVHGTPVYQSGDTNGDGLLDVDETWVYTLTVTAPTSGETAASGVAVGVGPETVNADGGIDAGETVNDDDQHHYTVAAPTIDIEKTVQTVFDADSAPGPAVAPGAPVRWEYTVTNTGPTTLTGVRVVDDMILNDATILCETGNNVIGVLLPGETASCVAYGTAIPSGQYTNIGTATGRGPATVGTDGRTLTPGVVVSDNDAANYWTGPSAITVVKTVQTSFDANTASEGPLVDPDGQVRFDYLVTNTGATELTDIELVDDIEGTITCPDTALKPAASMTCTITVDAIDSGVYANVGTVTGHGPDTVDADGNPVDGPTVTSDDPAHYTPALPQVDIEKFVQTTFDADVDGPAVAAGTTARFVYIVTNTGNVPLGNVTVTDDVEGAIECPQTTLAVSEQMTCILDTVAVNTAYTNLGTVTAVGPETIDVDGNPVPGREVSDTDPANYDGITPAIDIEKLVQTSFDADTAAEGPAIAAGSIARFTYQVTNIGNVPLTGVAVVDDVEGAIACPQTVLAAGETMTCTLDVEAVAGDYTNTGTVTGTGPGTIDENGDPVDGTEVSDQDDAHYHGVAPAISVVKWVNGADANTEPGLTVAAGTELTFTYLVTNTGTDALVDVALNDNVEGPVTCPKTELAAGESMTCELVGGQLDSGTYANIGTVTGVGPDTVGVDGEPVGGETVTDDDPAHAWVPNPSISIVKLVNGHDANTPETGPTLAAGSTAVFSYIVANTGDVDLVNVTVTDDKGVGVNCGVGGSVIPKLTPGEQVVCSGTQLAVAAPYKNTGTATGTPVVSQIAGQPPVVLGPVSASDVAHYNGAKVEGPVTGATTWTVLAAAACLAAVGGALLIAGRRRRRT